MPTIAIAAGLGPLVRHACGRADRSIHSAAPAVTSRCSSLMVITWSRSAATWPSM